MSSYIFGNGVKKIPGAYVNFRGSGNPDVLPTNYGNVLVLDTNAYSTAAHAVDCYVDETNIKEGLAKSTFSSLDAARDKIRGGLFWKLSELMFKPDTNAPTISSLTYQVLKGYANTSSINNYYTTTLTGVADPDGSDNFNLQVWLKPRGLGVATVLHTYPSAPTLLESGYSLVPKQSGTQFYFELYRSSYKDQNEVGDEYQSALTESAPELLFRTKKFSTLGQFKAYADTDTAWNFYVKQYTITSATAIPIDAGYLASTASINDSGEFTTFAIAGGGADSSATTKTILVDKLFAYIKDQSYDVIFLDVNIDDDVIVDQVISLIAETDHKPDLVSFAGSDSFSYTSFSVPMAQSANSEDVIMVHGGQKNFTYDGVGDPYYLGSIYQAAQVLGRIYGLPPYTPATFKTIKTKGQKHTLNTDEKNLAIDSGLLVINESNGTQEILKGVNTLQNNRVLINADGTTPSTQIKRIKRQLSKELVAYFNALLRANPLGPTRSTLSEAFVLDKTKVFLASKTADPTKNLPNLILGYKDVSVTFVQDAFFLNFEAYPDSEVSFAFVSPLLTIQS